MLLGLKKESDLLQPPTQKGVSSDLSQWQSVEAQASAARAALEQIQPDLDSYDIDRMDVRPDKGIVKVLFKRGYWEVQIDGSTLETLSVAKRHSDWIEALHDGSIISDLFKVISMNLLGIGLLTLAASGLWLWYGPKLIRNAKKKTS